MIKSLITLEIITRRIEYVDTSVNGVYFWQTSGDTIYENAMLKDGNPSTDFSGGTVNISGITGMLAGSKSYNGGWSNGTGGTAVELGDVIPPSKTIVQVNGEIYDVSDVVSGDPNVEYSDSSTTVNITHSTIINANANVVGGMANALLPAANTDNDNYMYDDYDNVYGAYEYDAGDVLTFDTTSPIGTMNHIHGMPFQWTSLTDRRYGTDFYGRAFARNIAANLPVVVIAPGKPKFLTNVTSSSLLLRAWNTVGDIASGVGEFFLPAVV